MVNGEALEHLKAFVEKPSRETATMLVGIPALMLVLESSLNNKKCLWDSLVELSKWMMQRTTEVWALVKGDEEPLEAIRDVEENPDWRKVSHERLI
jgi:hypothetical protein